MSKTFTYELQMGSDATSWRSSGGLEVITMPDIWTAFLVGQYASRDAERFSTSGNWRIVVWDGDVCGGHVREPDSVVIAGDLVGDCWCKPIAKLNGFYEWHCPSHGDRSWRPAARAFCAAKES